MRRVNLFEGSKKKVYLVRVRKIEQRFTTLFSRLKTTQIYLLLISLLNLILNLFTKYQINKMTVSVNDSYWTALLFNI